MDEATLINECVSGNPKAQKQLYDKFSGKMMGVCLRYTNSTEEAEDALQEGFVKIFSKIKDFKQEGSFEGWVRRIMVNCSLDSCRKNKKHNENVTIDKVDFMLTDSVSVIESIAAEDLMKLIQTIPYGYRVVFNMFVIEGFSHKEIAEHLGITESTSKSQFLRARSYLKVRVEELEKVKE